MLIPITYMLLWLDGQCMQWLLTWYYIQLSKCGFYKLDVMLFQGQLVSKTNRIPGLTTAAYKEVAGVCDSEKLRFGVKYLYLYWWSAELCLLPAATKLGQGNIFTSVCQEFCPQGGGSASVHAGIPPPQEQTPPPEQTPLREQTPPTGIRHPQGADTPPQGQAPWSRPPPPPESRLRHTVNERPVRILLECILVFLLWYFQVLVLLGCIEKDSMLCEMFLKTSSFMKPRQPDSSQ